MAIDRVTILAPRRYRQLDIAEAVGVSQQAVAKMAARSPLPATPLTAQERSAALQRYLSVESPAPLTERRFWTAPAMTLVEQAAAALQLAGELEIEAMVTGELAAAQLGVEVRDPARAEVYSSESMDLSVMGLVPTSETAATLAVSVPGDETVWPTAAWWARECAGTAPRFAAADPVQVVRDLAAAEGPAANLVPELAEWIAGRGR